jgi:hypothetical protein
MGEPEKFLKRDPSLVNPGRAIPRVGAHCLRERLRGVTGPVLQRHGQENLPNRRFYTRSPASIIRKNVIVRLQKKGNR